MKLFIKQDNLINLLIRALYLDEMSMPYKNLVFSSYSSNRRKMFVYFS